MSETNWAGNIAYGAKSVHAPRSIAELQELVRRTPKLRPLGSRHSFNRIADTNGALISMRRLNRVVSIDADSRTVTVEGGITYGELCPRLAEAGFALHNLASLPHISVVGAVSTATHGSGIANGNLAKAVSAVELIDSTGEARWLQRGESDFAGAVVALGALGVVSRMTLDIEPSYDIRQDVYTHLPFVALVETFDAIMGAAYSVSCFTRWRGDTLDFLWLKSRDRQPSPGPFFGAQPATRPWHPIAALDPTPCTEQMGVPGPWQERLPHFRLEFTPSAGDELQSEFFVPRRDAAAALVSLHGVQDRIAGPLLISEIRAIASDDLWLSPSYGEDSIAVHFTWRQDWPAVRDAIAAIEAALAPLHPKPHWGKLFTLPRTSIENGYVRLGDFRALAARFDPLGKFRNDFLTGLIL